MRLVASTRRRILGAVAGLVLASVGLKAAWDSRGLDRVPLHGTTDPQSVLARVGMRLSKTLSAGELTRLAGDGDQLLRLLTPDEREALGRGLLRIQTDRQTEIFVAAPRGSLPFWVDDRDFERTDLILEVNGKAWDIASKIAPPGCVELGVNRLDRKAEAHYVVFLRSVNGDAPRLEGLERGAWKVETAGLGSRVAEGVSLAITKLSPNLAGTTLLRPHHDMRHATVLASGRVWKTHVPSGPNPDQITVSFGEDASRSLTWTWRTDLSARRSVLRLSTVASEELNEETERVSVREFEGRAREIRLRELLNDPSTLRHEVRVDGLEPGGIYRYSVGDGTDAGMSPWRTIRTAPDASQPVRLMYLGDPQCGLEGWGKLLARSYQRHPQTSAILIAGDLVDRGNERSNWDHFFVRAAGVFDRVVMMPAVGNHEYLDRGPWLFRSFFRLPRNGPDGRENDLVYSFEIGDAFVAVLDSTRAVSDPKEAAMQAGWLDKCLAETERHWKLVMFHHPVYASHPTRENPTIREAWVPVFDRHSVDLVLQGHDHAYLRTYPMRGGERASSVDEGTTYVVSVSGDKYCDVDPRNYGEVAFDHISTYQTIEIDPRSETLKYRAWDLEGRERDRLDFTKPRRNKRLARSSNSTVR